MVVHLSFQIDGRDALSRVLQDISDDVQNWRPALEQMAADFYQTQGNVFQNEGSFEGLSGWPPLSPQYAIWKSNNYAGRPMLVLTGRLRAALTTPGAPGSIKQLDDRNLTLGVDVPVGSYNLARLHQDGTSRMPARPVLRLTDPQRSRWVRYLHTHLWETQLQTRITRELDAAFRLRLERP